MIYTQDIGLSGGQAGKPGLRLVVPDLGQGFHRSNAQFLTDGIGQQFHLVITALAQTTAADGDPGEDIEVRKLLPQLHGKKSAVDRGIALTAGKLVSMQAVPDIILIIP